MKIVGSFLPKKGDYFAFQVEILDDKLEREFILICKLTGTGLAIGLSRNKIKDQREALTKLESTTKSVAKEIYERKSYKKGASFNKFLSLI